MRKLKKGKELRDYKASIMQEHCPLCGRKMSLVETRNRCLDHDHKTGVIRDVLCRNCNGIEGKIGNLCTRAGTWVRNDHFLEAIIKYWRQHKNTPRDVQHPDHGKVKRRRTIRKRRT